MDWVRGSAVGRGSSSAVHLAFSRSYPPATFVVKSAPLASASLLQREGAILTDLQGCPQIISCFGHDITTDPTGGGIDRIYNLFLEYAAGGSLSDTIRRAGGGLPEPSIRRYLRSILLGLRHLHGMGYVHCDIKPENILIVDGEVKIADFGLAKKAAEESDVELRGTPMYMAPESAARKEYEAAADIWAFGCTVSEMVSGQPPWRRAEESENEVLALLMRIGSGDELPEIPPAMSEEGKDFLRCCFVKDPDNRWTAESLLSHPFVASSSELEPERNARVCSVPFITPTSVLGYLFSSVQSTCSETEMADLIPLRSDEDSARERIREIASDVRPDWASSSLEEDGWITVREASQSVSVEHEGEDILGPTSSCTEETVKLQICSPPLVSVSRSPSKNREAVNCEGGTRISFFAYVQKLCKNILLRIRSGFLKLLNLF